MVSAFIGTRSPPSALTTTMPNPARAMTITYRMASPVAAPATGPISSRAIPARLMPPRLVEAKRTIMSCTAPARQTPTTSQISPGR